MENDAKNKWYDNLIIVILLFFVFAPVGLFGFWKRGNKNFVKWFVGVIAALVIIGTLTENKETPAEVRAEAVRDSIENLPKIDTTILYSTSTYFAEKAIKSILKAPSTAEFPSEDIRVWYLRDSSIVVKGTVDSQNSFGAMIRSNYYVKLKWWNDCNNDENWRILECNLE